MTMPGRTGYGELFGTSTSTSGTSASVTAIAKSTNTPEITTTPSIKHRVVNKEEFRPTQDQTDPESPPVNRVSFSSAMAAQAGYS